MYSCVTVQFVCNFCIPKFFIKFLRKSTSFLLAKISAEAVSHYWWDECPNVTDLVKNNNNNKNFFRHAPEFNGHPWRALKLKTYQQIFIKTFSGPYLYFILSVTAYLASLLLKFMFPCQLEKHTEWPSVSNMWVLDAQLRKCRNFRSFFILFLMGLLRNFLQL